MPININGSTGISGVDGSAGTPALQGSDANTGVRFGTDIVSLVTGGSDRLYIDSSGRVGLGTSTPGSALEIKGNQPTANINTTTTGYAGLTFATNGVNDGGIYYYGTDDRLEFYAGDTGSPKAVLTAAGRVGIGTTSPSDQLHLSGGALRVSNGIGYGATFANTSSTGMYITLGDTGSSVGVGCDNGALTFRANGNTTERARIDSSGRLLVGTSTSPSVGDSQYSLISILGSTAGSTTDAYFSLRRGQAPASIASGSGLGTIVFGASDGSPYAAIAGQTDGSGGSGDYPGRLVFSTTADGASSPTERMRITNSGFTKFSNTGSYPFGGSRHEIVSSAADFTLQLTSSSSSPYGIYIPYSGAAPNGSGNEFIYCSDTAAVRFLLKSNGGINNYSANNVNLSDINAKKDISSAASTWDCLKDWEIVNFRYKDQPDDADLNMGVIAQQVAVNCPEVITIFQEAKEATDAEPAQEERLGVKDQQMMWMAIKALQEAQTRIETLEAANAALEARLTALEGGAS